LIKKNKNLNKTEILFDSAAYQRSSSTVISKVYCWEKGLQQGLFQTFEDFEFRAAAFTDLKK
jgi:hypothetical protein